MNHMLWTRRGFSKAALAVAAAGVGPAWVRAGESRVDVRADTTGPNSLRAHAINRGLFYGAAVIPSSLDVEGMAQGSTSDPYTKLVGVQTNIVVAENAMKWAALRPTAASFDFGGADRLMRFAALSGSRVRGHNLCWHEGLPAWFQATVNKENARTLLIEHIRTVAGRFAGQIHSWDVVNEAVNPKDGRADGLRLSPWLQLAGPDYVEVAFQTAAAADSSAKLTYNEYDIELDTPEQSEKRGQVMLLLRRLKARNIPIHAIGIQSHLKADGPRPGAGLIAFIRDAAKMNLEVYVTEMDVNARNIEASGPSQDEPVAAVYRDYLRLVLVEPNVKAVLTWGISSAHSWLNESKQPWAQRPDGTRQRPLPFDDDLGPTPAFWAIRDAIDATRSVTSSSPGPPPVVDPGTIYKPFSVQGSPTVEPPKPDVPQ